MARPGVELHPGGAPLGTNPLRNATGAACFMAVRTISGEEPKTHRGFKIVLCVAEFTGLHLQKLPS